MTWLLVIVVVVLVSGVVVLAVARGAAMRPAYDDGRDVMIPAGRPLRSDDLAAVRFTTAARGYRMGEVDAFLARLQAEMAAREQGPGPSLRARDDVTSPLREEGRHAG